MFAFPHVEAVASAHDFHTADVFGGKPEDTGHDAACDRQPDQRKAHGMGCCWWHYDSLRASDIEISRRIEAHHSTSLDVNRNI